MAADGGFAVAITIRERLLNDALLVAYAGDGFPRALAVDLPDAPPTASIDVFLAPPEIKCKASNALTITIQMWGALTVAGNGGAETRNVTAHLTLRIQPSFVVAGSDLVLEFDNVDEDVIATEWDFTVISGSGFPFDADSYLRSNSFIDRLQKAIRLAIAFRQVELPTIDIGFLGPVLTAVNNMTAHSRVVDGALLLGLNIESDDVTTVGDVDGLADFARDNDVAAVTSALAVPILLQRVKSQVSDEVAKNGATLEALKISAEAGRFHVEGRASKSTGTAKFSFNLIPKMFASKPGKFFTYLDKAVRVYARVWPALEFTASDIEVDVDPATWVVIVTAIGAIANIVVPLIVADLISSTAAQFEGAIATADTGAPVPRVRHLKPATPGGVTVRVAIEEYEITTVGTYIGITVRPQALPGMLIGVTSIPNDLRASRLRYVVRLPLGVQSNDPALRIRWTIIDQSGTVLVSEDDVALGRTTFDFVPQNVGPGLSELGVGVRVYRALGAQISDFVNDGVKLNVRGPLPPGAYVRWYYDVKNPQVRYDDENQTWAYTGEVVVKRHSNWHRTDRPCANVSKHSRFTYKTEILDSLPFAVADIAAHRAELCDYCFYGSPTGRRPSL